METADARAKRMRTEIIATMAIGGSPRPIPSDEWFIAEIIAARNEMREACVQVIKPMIVGQPKPYNWAKQNYNAGHDQALHKVARALRELEIGDET